MTIKDIGLTLQGWWKSWQKHRQEEREARRIREEKELEAQRIRDEEFRRTHEPCPICDKQIPKGLKVCPICEAPFGDTAALQTWKLQQEVKELRKQAARAHAQDKQEKANKRGNNQGCGCMLLLAGLVLCAIFPPLGGLMCIIGLVILIVGLCS